MEMKQKITTTESVSIVISNNKTYISQQQQNKKM